MNTYLVAAVASGLLLTAGGVARAESEGNGDPFPHRARPHLTAGHAFLSDDAQAPYPLPTGHRALPSALATLEPAYGAEAVVQTANSLPLRASEGTVAYAQWQEQTRAMARSGRVLEAGVPAPRG